MNVTRFNYPLESTLVKVLDAIIDRCHGKCSKKDTVLGIEGGEGEGKTTSSIAIAYYVSEKTGRPFNAKHVFFDAEEVVKFAQSTKEQIIIWDEPALQALSTDWASSVVKNITRLLMMARKKRHFIMINMTKFFKFNEYIVVDRCVGMIHMYTRKSTNQSGRFIYIPQRNLEPLWRDYRYTKKRNYNKYKSKKCRGAFPDVLNPKYQHTVASEFDLKYYEDMKDKAIKSIGTKDDKMNPKLMVRQREKEIINNFEELKKKGEITLTQPQQSGILGISVRKIRNILREIREAEVMRNNHINKGTTPLGTLH